MKKITALLLFVSVLVSFASCASDGYGTEATAATTAVSTEHHHDENEKLFGTLDELNAVLGTDIVYPAEMNPSEVLYATLTVEGVLTAQCEFVIADASYIIRAAKSDAHISSYHYGDKLVEDSVTDGTDVPPTAVSPAGGFWARWFEGDIQYLMFTADGFDGIFQTLYEIEK